MDLFLIFIFFIIVLFFVYEILRLRNRYITNLEIAKQHNFPVVKQFIPYYSLWLKIIPKFLKKGYYNRDFSHSEELLKTFEKLDSPLFAFVSYSDIAIFLNDPLLIKEACITRKKSVYKATHLYGVLKLFGENIVTADDGPNWKKHRIAANPAFNEENCKLVAKSTIQQLNNMFNQWDNSKDNIVNITNDSINITLSIISEAGFGQRFNLFSHDSEEISDEYKKLGLTIPFKNVMEIISKHTLIRLILPKLFFKVLPFKHLKYVDKGFNEFEVYANYFIKQCANNDNKNDLLSLLVKENDQLTNQNVVADIFMFLIAGHETTANTVTFALGLLATYPDVQKKVYEESKRIFSSLSPDSCDDNIYSKLNEFVYTRAVFEETLRLYPSVVNIPKWTVSETKLGDFTIPDQTQIVLSTYALHRNPKHWDDPNSFKPERFLSSERQNKANTSYDFIPFSLGNRSCIGKKFAVIEAILSLSYICYNYNLEVDQCGINDIQTILTLQTKKPVTLKATKRS